MSSSFKYTTLGIIFIVIFALFTSCEGLTDFGGVQSPIEWEDGPGIVEAEDGNLSDSVKNEWKESARELALRAVIEQDSTMLEVPENLIRTFYNGLIHILKSGTPEAELAAIEFGVRARPAFKHDEVLVYPDTSEASDWLNAWRNGETLTGNSSIDELIEKYELTLRNYSELQSQAVALAVLRSARFVNPIPIANDFAKLPVMSDSYTGVNMLVGDGSDIKADVRQTSVRYRFEYGWGDCPAGCISRHFWGFSVNADGDVDFFGEGGNALPDEK